MVACPRIGNWKTHILLLLPFNSRMICTWQLFWGFRKNIRVHDILKGLNLSKSFEILTILNYFRAFKFCAQAGQLLSVLNMNLRMFSSIPHHKYRRYLQSISANFPLSVFQASLRSSEVCCKVRFRIQAGL